MEYTLPVVVAVIIAINEVLKNLGVPKKVIPLVSLVVGVVCSIAIVPEATIQLSVLKGIIIGLSANGLFDVTKITKNKTIDGTVKEDPNNSESK